MLVIISRVYRTPPSEGIPDILQQQGIPAARQGIGLSREGVKLLSADEQRELSALYGEVLQGLSPAEKQRFLAIVQKGTAADDREITESGELMQKALRALPAEKSARLWALVEKAVRLQLAQQEAQTKRGQQ